MKIGAEDKKKVAAVVVLGLFAVYMVWSNLLSGPSAPSSPRVAAPAAAQPQAGARQPVTATQGGAGRRATARVTSEDWHPVVHAKRPEDQVDTTKVDPTVRLDLLAKLQEVAAAGGGRNLFSMSAAPPPKLPDKPEPKIPVKAVMGPPP